MAVEYLLYLLREVSIEGGLLDSPYFHSVAPTSESEADAIRALRGVRLTALGDVRNLEWIYPDLTAWASAQMEAA